MKEHLNGFAKDDYVAFITEYVWRIVCQYGPAPADDVQRKLVRGGLLTRRSHHVTVTSPRSSKWNPSSTLRLAPHEGTLSLVLTALLLLRQTALQLSRQQGLVLAALTRTMIGQLSALSQRFKALDDVEESSSPVDGPPPDGGRQPHHPATESGPEDHRRPALRRCSPESAALRVRAVSGTCLDFMCT